MVKNFVLNHTVVSIILMVGAISLLLQLFMTFSLKGYVKASANMKTTKKKILINLKNQFEAIYGMDCQIHNAAAYVDKYLLKLRIFGIPYMACERIPFITAGVTSVIAVAGAFYEYKMNTGINAQAEILYACGVVLACLFACFHIFGIKSRKQQIQIQLVDYLENYLSNHLTRVREDKLSIDMGELDPFEDDELSVEPEAPARSDEDDMMMLRRLLSQMENGESRAYTRMQAEREKDRAQEEQIAVAVEEQSDMELLEEFVQSFLA